MSKTMTDRVTTTRYALHRLLVALRALRAWVWPNPLRPMSYRAGHRYTRHTPLGAYACELCYRYRLQHPTAGIFGRYSGVGVDAGAHAVAVG